MFGTLCPYCAKEGKKTQLRRQTGNKRRQNPKYGKSTLPTRNIYKCKHHPYLVDEAGNKKSIKFIIN